ncbi:MAG: tetratricopeptide repeat protein [Symploca sp. SIO2G7]|nr:tetratricopeptide repeat protein [Symploca sp. SIO2G7]
MVTTTSTATELVDYYQVLGLQPEWDTERLRKELRDAFAGTKARVNAATGKKKDDIDQRLKWITQARKILLDPDERPKYDQELAEWKRTATPEQKAAAAAIPTLQELWQLIDEGRYLDAIEAGKRLAEHTPDDDQAWEVYGYANYLWHDYQTAIYAGEQAIRCNPQKAELYADVSQYLAAAQQWNEAVLQLNRAIQLEPDNPGYKLTLANIYIKHEIWSDGEAVLKGVLNQDPSNQTARSLMAIVISSQAEARFPEINALLEANKKREARKILKEVQQQFEEANKLAENNPDLKDLLNSESILVRRVLGVNFYRRILGVVVDSVLVLPAILLMSIDNGNNPIALTFGLLIMIGILGYSWVWLAFKNRGQDLTKRLLSMQVVDDNDSLPSLGQLIGRAIVKPVAIGLGGLFPFLVVMLSMFGAFAEVDAAGTIGWIIGLTIGVFVLFFKLGFDLFFVTSKDLMPNLFGFLLFMHERITKTTVINATQDDSMNFGEYHWY